MLYKRKYAGATVDDNMKMDFMRAPFGIRTTETIHFAPHLDYDRFEPELDGNGYEGCSGFFYLCTYAEFKSTLSCGICSRTEEHRMRIHLEPFVPSDHRSSVASQAWMSDPSLPQLLCCISLKHDPMIEMNPKIGSTGRISISGSLTISPDNIDSAWEYPDSGFKNPRLLYHQLLINEAVTGYAGGARTRPTRELLAKLAPLVSESAASVSGTTTAGNLRLVPARDSSLPPGQFDEEPLVATALVVVGQNVHDLTP